MKVKLKSSC